ncbi:MAG: phosphoglycerate dehydrogenase [Pyrinomonadaceae bacterium]
MSDCKVFVADDVNDEKLAPLRDAGINVHKETKLPPDELAVRMADANGVIVRSATKITAELMDAAPNLKVIGRAGVGVDNIDVKAATERGIVVMNAPDGNTITTAEHTFALLISMARNIPQANALLNSGTWDKKRFVGVELHGKTLGVIGLGRIGRHVSRIARGFGMKVLGYDPFVSEDVNESGIVLESLDNLISGSDFITIHTPVTDETRGIIGAAAFAMMKDGVRIVNCARGGLVNETALLEALESGKVAGAALDVFESEPLSADSPLLNNPKIVATPHLGASTREAQEGVALTVAEQMRDYLLTGELRNAVNAPSMAAEELEKLKPYIDLAKNLGSFHRQVLGDERITEVKLEFCGQLAESDCGPVIRAFLKGLLENVSNRINEVNAIHVAEERGIDLTTSLTKSARVSPFDISSIVVSGEVEQTASGSVYGDGVGRLTKIGNFSVEIVPSGYMLFAKNRDVPGVIGRIGSLLGDHGVNISRFYLGRNEEGGEALSVIALDSPPASSVIDELRGIDTLISVKQVMM